MYRDERVEFREKEFKTTILASNVGRSLSQIIIGSKHSEAIPLANHLLVPFQPTLSLARSFVFHSRTPRPISTAQTTRVRDNLIPALLPRLSITPHVLPTRMESPVRILIIVKRSALAWQQAWEEPQKLITQVLKHLQYNSLVSPDDLYNSSSCRFLAIERWDSHTFIVCDLFNTSYNPLDAHQEGNNELPVKVVRICQGDQSDIIKAKEPQAIGRVDEQLRSIHDMHGWNEGPPYKIDHADGKYPIYTKPRSMVYT
ncbi:hypothetical protein IWW34DRAFT_811353 [Fusarium oxysporum f. sp. albedinis]|uniref:Uncharacterized protein n=1 Tax=Fusarium oxysporum (strain Fo5176) TaxID=660025 RepID=F9G0X5_FUSOF|nr:hypothetical protein FOXB_12307 [Fusarium oxysporum f. sp. conglutinans Fo5176]KAI3572172.1 hypothetical protein IWW34DRAFT_811353 [Fusarium oxysporum f. sp. albedinis]KAJ0135051.1 Uncharacterized protein HZ326_21895 [Fusarium oxysporum f. sp. albedinis]